MSEAILRKLVLWFEDAESETTRARAKSETYRDYYDNKQLSPEEIKALRARGQPAIVINKIKRKINFLKGLELQQRVDPKAFPRNPQDEESAHAATDALRYVADNNRLDSIRSKVWENMLIEGYGGAEVTVEEQTSRVRQMGTTALQRPSTFEVRIRRYPWDRLFYDPHSSADDFSDARYFGGMAWLDLDEATAMWPKSRRALEFTLQNPSGEGETFEDKPKHKVWADTVRKRVRVVKINARLNGKWHIITYTRGGILEGGVSPYEDEFGQPEPDLILQSAYVDRENERYGEVRELIDPQDEMNKRRSKALHLLNTRQIIADRGAVLDSRIARAEAAKPDGYIELSGGANARFEIQTNTDLAVGQTALLEQSAREMDHMGPNAAMQGKLAREDQSGRAIQAQQQGGFIEVSPLLDSLRAWNIRVYRTIWNRVRQFWTEERWVRVTDDENNVKFVGLNRQMTMGEMALERMKGQGATREQLSQAEAQFMQDPRALQPVTMNQVATMDMDIIVEDAPDTITIQHEQFREIVALAERYEIPLDIIIEASQLRNKQQLLERLRGGGQDPEAAAEQAQIQQAAMQLEFAEKQAEIEKTVAETGKIEVETAAKAMDAGVNAELKEAQADKAEAEVARTLTDILAPPERAQHI